MTVTGLRGFVDPAGARLAVNDVTREELVLGAFQRAASAVDAAEAAARGLVTTRRLSGGPAVLAGPGTLHVALSLPSPDAVVACDAPRLVNRHVRPLLAALGHLGARAHYFGRDWISVAHRPVAWIGWAHEAAGGASLVEAFVALTHPFALPPALDAYPARAADPFLGRAPATVSEAAGKSISCAEARGAIVRAYDSAYPGKIAQVSDGDAFPRVVANDARERWSAVVEEAIGFVGAAVSGGRLEIGGDWMVSEELPEALAGELGALAEPSVEAVLGAIDRALSRGAVVMDGVKRRASIAEVAVDAVRGGRTRPSR